MAIHVPMKMFMMRNEPTHMQGTKYQRTFGPSTDEAASEESTHSPVNRMKTEIRPGTKWSKLA